MASVTDTQIQKARETDLFAYLQSYEPGVLKRDGPNYRHREHDSLVYVTSKGYWYWNSRGRSINALDYLIQIRGYWDSNVEMTARAFACYIKDKLPYASDYLAGHADCALTMVTNKDGSLEIIKAFPEGEERKAINAVFDEIIQDLKWEQILTHSDITLPLPAAERQQISLFDDGRPSVLGQLATAKAQEKSAGVKPAVKKKEDMQL